MLTFLYSTVVITTFLLLPHFYTKVFAANILAVFPTPSYSHHSVFKVYIRALAEKGHNIVVLKSTTRINYDNTNDEDDLLKLEYDFHQHRRHYHRGNISEIDASLSEEYFQTLMKSAGAFRKRGIVADVDTVTAQNYMGMIKMISDQFDLPQVRRFIEQSRDSFDLLITEAFFDYPLVFSYLFDNIPVIQISSGHGVAENFETMGAVSRHPIYYPNLWRSKISNLSTWQTIAQIFTELRLQREFSILIEEQDKMLKQQFGHDTPTIEKLRENVQLLLINTHAIFDNNRPVPPSVQYLGGLHLKYKSRNFNFISGPVNEFLNASNDGAVYVSFGSGIDTRDMDAEFINMLFDTFERLPFSVLWKYDSLIDTSKINVPNNVFIQKWFNQYELLHHRNVLAFVTQGGVQSTDEAIDALVPLVGLPMMGDQFLNTNKYIELGIGRVVDPLTVSATQLTEAIIDVASNDKYRKNIKALRHTINNQLVPPVQRAIWYTEHVINSRNNRRQSTLKTKAANVNYSDYLMSYIFIPMIMFVTMNHLQQLLNSITNFL